MQKEDIKEEDAIAIEEIQKIMTKTLKRIHDVCQKNDLQYFLAYGSLLGALRHNDTIPWDDDVDIYMNREDFNKFLEIGQRELGDDYFLQTPLTDSKYDILHVPVKVRDEHSTLIEEYGKQYHQGAFVDIFVFDDITDNEEEFHKLWKRAAFIASLKMRISWKEQSGIKKYIRILLQLIFKLVPAKTVYNYNQKLAKQYNAKISHGNKKFHSGIGFLDNDYFTYDEIYPMRLHAYGDYEFYIPHLAEKLMTDYYGNWKELPKEEERQYHGLFYSDKKVF